MPCDAVVYAHLHRSMIPDFDIQLSLEEEAQVLVIVEIK